MDPYKRRKSHFSDYAGASLVALITENTKPMLTLNIPSLARQRYLPSWGPRRTPWFCFVISQLFDAVDYSNYVFWVSETIIQ